MRLRTHPAHQSILATHAPTLIRRLFRLPGTARARPGFALNSVATVSLPLWKIVGLLCPTTFDPAPLVRTNAAILGEVRAKRADRPRCRRPMPDQPNALDSSITKAHRPLGSARRAPHREGETDMTDNRVSDQQ